MDRKNVSVLVVVLIFVAALAACGGGDPEQRTIAIGIEHGALTGAPSLEVGEGDTVTFEITSDEAGSFHLHGYDVEVTVEAGVLAELPVEVYVSGRFPFTFHRGGADGGHEHDEVAAACEPPLDNVTLDFAVEAGERAGEFIASIAAPGFDLGVDGKHWHLHVDGELHGMYTAPDVDVSLSEGTHTLEAALAGPEHCDYGVAREVPVVVGEGGDGGHGAGHDEHTEEGEEIELGALVVNP